MAWGVAEINGQTIKASLGHKLPISLVDFPSGRTFESFSDRP